MKKIKVLIIALSFILAFSPMVFAKDTWFGGETNYVNIETDGSVTLVGAATFAVPSYTRHVQIVATPGGKVADKPATEAYETTSCVEMINAGGKFDYPTWEIPNDWDGGDVIIEVDWMPFSAGIGAGETVVYNLTYRSLAEGEGMANGTVATTTPTYTDGGAGTAQYLIVHTAQTLTFNHANQPLTVQDHMFFRYERGTDTFTGDTCITAYEVVYQSTGIPSSN